MSEGGSSSYVGPLAMLVLGGLAGTFLVMHLRNAPETGPGASPVAVPGPVAPKGPTPADLARLEKTQRQAEAGRLIGEGNTALAAGEIDGALAKFNAALERDPGNPKAEVGAAAARKEELFSKAFARAQELYSQRNLDEARKQFQKARELKESPEVVAKLNQVEHDLWLRSGLEAEGKRDWQNALACYEKAKALLPSPDAEKAVARAQLGAQVERSDERRKTFAKHFDRATALEKEGKLTEAIAAYRQALPHTESAADVQSRIDACERKQREIENLFAYWMKKADAAADAGKVGEAEAALKKAAECRPSDPSIPQKLAELRERATVQDMVLIPAAEFSSVPEPGDGGGAPRKATLKAYYIDRREVSSAQYKDFLDANPSQPAPRSWLRAQPGRPAEIPKGQEACPVMGVSAEDAAAYAKWSGKRLPTEDEWEYAARGADGRVFPWGNEFDKEKGNTIESGKGGPLPVGSFPEAPSAFGLLDMAGNVAEWTATTADFEVKDPSGESRIIKYGVLKGGSFLLPSRWARSSTRYLENPKLRLPGVGFRCARDGAEK
ncbi:MAG: SUMF1/EgtB/PvdO family nonheme iron enzyme [Planctomycetes bacterium]|nr:SUMF1/EgtB/PvdO family nonheme iron enzyme [Planctomycetota bacterium]